jgi:hypothetical protein
MESGHCKIIKLARIVHALILVEGSSSIEYTSTPPKLNCIYTYIT